jgi:glucans biosynthesis protein C
MAPSSIALSRDRAFFLDWLRIIAFGLLVLYHVGMYYATWDFHVKSPFASQALEPWMKLTEPWRMSLIFMISGAVTALMLKTGPTLTLTRRRTRFLLLPLLSGVLLIVPPQSYFEVVQKFNYTGNYFEFLKLYFGRYKGFCTPLPSNSCLILPTWNHLWFLPYLWVYTMIIFGLSALWPDCLRKLSDQVDRWGNPFALLIFPVALLFMFRLTLTAKFPVTHALIGDWFSHAMYFSMFGIGAVLASSKTTWAKFSALRWFALIGAITGWAIFAFSPPAKPLQFLIVSMFQWCAIVAAFGFAIAHLNRDGRFRAVFTEAVFPIYILHQTIIIVGSQWLLPLTLSPLMEGLVLIAATYLLSYLGYFAIKRIKPLHSWFGIRSDRVDL